MALSPGHSLAAGLFALATTWPTLARVQASAAPLVCIVCRCCGQGSIVASAASAAAAAVGVVVVAMSELNLRLHAWGPPGGSAKVHWCGGGLSRGQARAATQAIKLAGPTQEEGL